MKIKTNHPIIVSVFFAIVIIATSRIVFTQIVDVDGWWHIACGKELVEDRSLDFSKFYWSETTEDYSNVNFTWMGDVWLYLVYKYFGDVGLSVLRFILILIGILCIWLVGNRKANFIKLFAVVLCIVGMYQGLLVRNSMFAIAFFPAMLYCLDSRHYILSVFLLVIWSQVHGSYLLGISVIPFFFSYRFNKKSILLACALAAIFYFNPLTKSYISYSKIKQIVSEKSPRALFGTSSESIEFKSPFDVDRAYVNACIMMISLILLFVRFKNVRLWLLFCCITLFGMSYLRLVKYVAMYGLYFIFKSEKDGNLRHADKMVFLILAVSACVYSFFWYDKIIYEFNAPGIHKSEFKFSDKVFEYTKSNYMYEKTFTTMSNGGYGLIKWQPEKKVYIDTYFAPHSQKTMDDYKKYIREPVLLKEVCSTAIIGLSDMPVVINFIQSRVWFPEAIDQGMILFNTEKKRLKILIGKSEFDELSEFNKKSFRTALGICTGRIKFR